LFLGVNYGMVIPILGFLHVLNMKEKLVGLINSRNGSYSHGCTNL